MILYRPASVARVTETVHTDRDGLVTHFSKSSIFDVEYLKNGAFKDTVSIEH